MAVAKLTDRQVKALAKPGRYGDGAGLWLQVTAANDDEDLAPGAKPRVTRSWLFRYTWAGRQRQMGLGPFPDITLARARELALEARRAVLDGHDPVAQRRQARADQAGIAFDEVGKLYLGAHQGTWKNAKHRAQWESTLKAHASPVLGKLAVRDIGVADVMRAIQPIWHTTPETASRLRGRVEAILDFAAARGWRSGPNPARWRGHLDHLLPARTRVQAVQHHPALAWREIGAFMAAAGKQEGGSAIALRFTILTAARSGEALGATWGEIDLTLKVWTVPGARMKAKREHRVPLSDGALEVLQEAAKLRTDPLPSAPLFPSNRGVHLSNMSMAMALRRMGHGDLTVHGFRSTFRDWCAEATNFPRELAEAALAHTLKDKTEAAYARSDLIEKRRKLMEAWARFCTQAPSKGSNIRTLGNIRA